MPPLSPNDATARAPTAPGPLAPALAALVQGRRSTRRFTAAPVADGWLEQMLAEARQAPSGANLQPGEFIRLEGDARRRLTEAMIAAHRCGEPAREDYGYFPEPMPMTLRKRQVAAAQALYGALGAGRDDQAARSAQFERNYRFFDAPLALLVTIDARMGAGCYMDLGMCLYGLMLAAAARGLGCCAIGALASYPALIRQTLGLDAGRAIVCGLAIGHPDPDAPENAVRTARRAVADCLQVMR